MDFISVKNRFKPTGNEKQRTLYVKWLYVKWLLQNCPNSYWRRKFLDAQNVRLQWTIKYSPHFLTRVYLRG